MKKLIVILIGVLTTINIWGAKAYPEPITITQKDGKMLTYRLHGDENFFYITTTDGVLLCRKGKDYFIAIIDENGKSSSSNVLAHNAGQRTAEEIALISNQDMEKFFTAHNKSQVRKGMKRLSMPPGATTLFPHLGTPKALVILADFTDQSFKHDDQTTMEIFDQYLNAPGQPDHSSDNTLKKNIGSVSKYFNDMSNGLFTPQFDVATVVHLNNPMETYGYDVYDSEGTITDVDPNYPSFIKDVCKSAHEAGVNFSDYDENNDGYVDLVYIIYAGYGESTGGDDNTLWPKSGTVSGESYDGKTVSRYGIHSELNFNPDRTVNKFNGVPQINGIGLFCHEFTHCMGLADFYPTHKYDNYVPAGELTAQQMGNPAMEYWDLMDGGEYSYNGYIPTAYTAWEREYMGWMEMDVLKAENSGQKIELINIDKNNGKAYKIFPDDDETGNEYVFIQNIQPYGWNYWLANYFGHGMLVTYVCYDKTAFSLGGDIVNSIPNKSRMTIVPADEEYISSYLTGDEKQYTQAQYVASLKGDPFPGTSDVHELLSVPMIWGGYNMEKPLLNIQEKNGVITFYYLREPQIATDINGVDIVSTPNETRIYTLDGRYVGKSTRGLAKGIYIINGKKTVIR